MITYKHGFGAVLKRRIFCDDGSIGCNNDVFGDPFAGYDKVKQSYRFIEDKYLYAEHCVKDPVD